MTDSPTPPHLLLSRCYGPEERLYDYFVASPLDVERARHYLGRLDGLHALRGHYGENLASVVLRGSPACLFPIDALTRLLPSSSSEVACVYELAQETLYDRDYLLVSNSLTLTQFWELGERLYESRTFFNTYSWCDDVDLYWRLRLKHDDRFFESGEISRDVFAQYLTEHGG